MLPVSFTEAARCRQCEAATRPDLAVKVSKPVAAHLKTVLDDDVRGPVMLLSSLGRYCVIYKLFCFT